MTNTRAIANRYSYLLRTAQPEFRSAGESWYATARAQCSAIAMEYGVSHDAAAMVVAALSPRVHWSRNIRQAREFFETGTISGLVTNERRAINSLIFGIDAFSPNSAPKTRAFAYNLMGNESIVTLDVWMIRAAGLPTNIKLNYSGRYEAISGIVTRLAHRNSLTPAQTQAIIWVAARGRAD